MEIREIFLEEVTGQLRPESCKEASQVTTWGTAFLADRAALQISKDWKISACHRDCPKTSGSLEMGMKRRRNAALCKAVGASGGTLDFILDHKFASPGE